MEGLLFLIPREKVLLYEGSQGMMKETRITREEIQKLSEEKF